MIHSKINELLLNEFERNIYVFTTCALILDFPPFKVFKECEPSTGG